MLDAAPYDLMMEVSGAIYGAANVARARSGEPADPPPPLLQLRAGLAESPGWFLVQAAEFDPEPLTVANVRVRDVYASERIVQALLELMAGERWLDRTEQGAYRLVEAGHGLLQRFRLRRRAIVATLQPLPPADTARLASLLGRLIDASLGSATPPGTWCLAHSRNRAPAADAPPLVQIAQYFEDFNAFRDDAHMAAWQPQEIGGHAWEAFALVCAGARSIDVLFDRLIHRGYSRSEYDAALAEVALRGWLEPGGMA